jgi:hypothetical protein
MVFRGADDLVDYGKERLSKDADVDCCGRCSGEHDPGFALKARKWLEVKLGPCTK